MNTCQSHKQGPDWKGALVVVRVQPPRREAAASPGRALGQRAG